MGKTKARRRKPLGAFSTTASNKPGAPDPQNAIFYADRCTFHFIAVRGRRRVRKKLLNGLHKNALATLSMEAELNECHEEEEITIPKPRTIGVVSLEMGSFLRYESCSKLKRVKLD